MKKDYKGLVWTDHALGKLKERGIKQGDAWATFQNPDSSKKAKTSGAFIYYKTFEDTKIEVVAKKVSSASTRNKQWVIISVWSKKIGNENAGDGILSKLKNVLRF